MVRNKLRVEKYLHKPLVSAHSNNYFRLSFNKLRLGATGQKPIISRAPNTLLVLNQH